MICEDHHDLGNPIYTVELHGEAPKHENKTRETGNLTNKNRD